MPQAKRSIQARDIVVSTYPGYTVNQAIGNAAINASLDCNKKASHRTVEPARLDIRAHVGRQDTYMGVKLFTTAAFDTALCAAACTAQSQYNTPHPPADRSAQTCQFYNTYALYKNDVYEGQYWYVIHLYSNTGIC